MLCQKNTSQTTRKNLNRVDAHFLDSQSYFNCRFIGDDFTDSEYKNVIDQIKELSNLVKKYCKDIEDRDQYFVKEILLWGLTSFKKLTKNRMEDGIEFKDSLGSYLRNLNS